MSVVSLPVTRPIGRALVVAAPAARAESLRLLREMGYECAEADEPYSAMRELCSHRLAYHAIILSLAGLYREELALISAVKHRFPHVEVWLTQTDGRQAALADGVRSGADGLLAADGLHRIAPEVRNHESKAADRAPLPALRSAAARAFAGSSSGTSSAIEHPSAEQEIPHRVSSGANAGGRRDDRSSDDISIGEPVLSADELRALLQDQPLMPPSGSAD